MVKVGTIGQAQAEFMLKRYGVLPNEIPEYVPPVAMVTQKGETE